MSFVLRMPDDLEERVRARADAEHRTMHGLVLHAVERYVAETVSDADFEQALADVGPYARDVFGWYDTQERKASTDAATSR